MLTESVGTSPTRRREDGRRRPRGASVRLSVLAAVLLVLALAGCGGGDSAEPAATETEATSTEAETDEAVPTDEETETDEADGSSSGATDAAAPAGQGSLTLSNGTVYAFAVTECTFQPSGTFEITGAGDDGSTFDMTQFYLGEEWSQTDMSIDSGQTKVYVIARGSVEGAAPATVDGRNVRWAETFRELDAAANAQTTLGEGTLNLTCP